MRKCMCGYLLRSSASTCPRCDRTLNDSEPFIERLDKIELAFRLIPGKGMEISRAEAVARTCLARDMSLLDIAKELGKL
jgi:hypothetical protein